MKLQKSGLGDADMKALKNTLFMEEWKIDFTIYQRECKKFYEAWVKAYALIWDSYCSQNFQQGIKEMPEFENLIINGPLALLITVETLIHTPEKVKYLTLTLIEVLLSFMKVIQGNRPV